MVQKSKRKVPHIYTELIRRTMTLKQEKLLLLMTSQSKVASDIEITGWKKKQQVISCMPLAGILRCPCDVQAVKNTFINDDNNDCK